MQFREWLKRNFIRATEVARRWGVADSYLSRETSGEKWPSSKVIIGAYKLSGGRVSIPDWVETCRGRLEADGIIQPGEKIHGEADIRSKGIRGAKPGKRKRKAAGGEEQAQGT